MILGWDIVYVDVVITINYDINDIECIALKSWILSRSLPTNITFRLVCRISSSFRVRCICILTSRDNIITLVVYN